MTDGISGQPLPREDELVDMVADLIAVTYGIAREQLGPDQRIGDFGVDSIFGGAVLDTVEREACVEIDFRLLDDSWAELTLLGLARQLRAAMPGGAAGAGE